MYSLSLPLYIYIYIYLPLSSLNVVKYIMHTEYPSILLWSILFFLNMRSLNNYKQGKIKPLIFKQLE